MDKNKRNSSSAVHINRTRLIVVLVFIGVFSACIIGKLFILQIIQGNDFSKRADRQYAPSSTDSFDRGTIYATTKDGTHVELATVTQGFKIAIVPDQVKDKEAVFTALQPYITMPHDEFMTHANKAVDPY